MEDVAGTSWPLRASAHRVRPRHRPHPPLAEPVHRVRL